MICALEVIDNRWIKGHDKNLNPRFDLVCELKKLKPKKSNTSSISKPIQVPYSRGSWSENVVSGGF